jgi:energy-coupling factor transporter transmembrane protein EcfT
MKNVLKIIAFIIYTVLLFLIKDIWLIFGAIIFQIALTLICHISINQSIKTLIKLMPFILFTVLINLCVMETIEAILIGIKLIIVCNMTYIYGSTTTAREIAISIEKLLFPLTLFKVNTRNIGIMICIAITFIPIINKEIENIQYSLTAKGFNMSFWSKIRHINYIMVPLFYGLIRKVGNMEEALIAKGYMGE